MLKTRTRPMWWVVLFATMFFGLLSAQMTITGTLSGTVVDPSGQVIRRQSHHHQFPHIRNPKYGSE